jgi:peptidoglycan/LPS O-acetylase OafA/YrhL
MKLQRITTHGAWIPEIDGLRFVAIASTLLTHILGETVTQSGRTFSACLTGLMLRGGRGVPLFFAISGFILAQPFLRQHLLHGPVASVKAYFKRRLTRLEPPYILSLLIYTASVAIHRPLGSLILPLLAHIVYLHNFTTLKTLNFVTWSLEVEVQFYILAPVLGYLYAISSPVLRRGIIVSLIVASAIFQYSSHGAASRNLPGQLQFFLVGFLLADLRATRTASTTSRWWDMVSLVVWVAIFTIPVAYISFSFPALILIAYLAAFNGPASRQVFRTPWIALTGGMCWSFYLMHMLIIYSVMELTRRLLVPSNLPLSFLIQTALIGPCICVFCTIYFVLIERPCMDPNWPRKLIARLSNPSRPTEIAFAGADSSEDAGPGRGREF